MDFCMSPPHRLWCFRSCMCSFISKQLPFSFPGSIIALEPLLRPFLARLAPQAASRLRSEAIMSRNTDGQYFRVWCVKCDPAICPLCNSPTIPSVHSPCMAGCGKCASYVISLHNSVLCWPQWEYRLSLILWVAIHYLHFRETIVFSVIHCLTVYKLHRNKIKTDFTARHE